MASIKTSRRRLWIVLFIVFSFIMPKIIALRITNMTVPGVVDFRNNISIDCHFDMGSEDLYAIKWYKDDAEFFRYMPHQQPHIMTFPVSGVVMYPYATDCGQRRCKVLLGNLTQERSGGSYRCEVSSEAPAFRLASQTHNVTVAGLPTEGPRIDNVAESYQVGHILTARCTSPSASPIPSLTWYINEQEAARDIVTEGSASIPDEYGLASRSSWLRFQIERKYIEGNQILLRCTSALPGVPLHPQGAVQMVTIRSEKQEPVNNQQRVWYQNFSGANSISIRSLIFFLALAVFHYV